MCCLCSMHPHLHGTYADWGCSKPQLATFQSCYSRLWLAVNPNNSQLSVPCSYEVSGHETFALLLKTRMTQAPLESMQQLCDQHTRNGRFAHNTHSNKAVSHTSTHRQALVTTPPTAPAFATTSTSQTWSTHTSPRSATWQTHPASTTWLPGRGCLCRSVQRHAPAGPHSAGSAGWTAGERGAHHCV